MTEKDRAWALEAGRYSLEVHKYDPESHKFFRLAIEALKDVRPTGHWIEEIDDYGKVVCWHCDKCYEESGFTTDCKWDFCPNCGARMENGGDNA